MSSPKCEDCGAEVELERIPGCEDPVFRAYCKACDAQDELDDDRFDRDELGIDPEEDYELS